MNDIGKKIKESRELVGLTQDQLAEKAGMNTVQLSKYERGVNTPGGKAISKLAQALGIPLVAEPATVYGISTIHQALTPAEAEALRIMRECPEALAVVRMMGDVDSDTQNDILRIAEKEKLLQDMIKERIDKKTA